MDDRVAISLIAAAGAGLVGAVGLLLIPLLRRTSVLVAFVGVAAVAVGGFVAGLLGAANAMFLSTHDFGVVLVVSVVAGLVSIVVACLLAVPIVRGSRAVRDAARELGETGRYVAPDRTPTTELRELSQEMDAAAGRLALSRERQEAAEASRRKLVAWVSHDLRTPLASLRAMAEALEDGMVEDPDRYHRQMRVEVDRTTELVDDLFALSRIDADALVLDLQRVDLGDVISDSLAVAEPLSAERGVLLSGESAPGIVLRGDARHLHRMLGNLLGNAIRHTVPGESVRVAAREEGVEAVVAVSDGCGGIPPSLMAELFDAGLGLGIVRGIVQAHGGGVAVRNADRGCVFEVRLPLGVV